jgi:putative membrane protein
MSLTMKRLITPGLLCFALALTPVMARAEDETPIGTMPGWTWPPEIIVPLILLALIYAAGTAKIWRREARRASSRLPALSFALGWLSLVIALDSPLHELGEQLFWVHMTQHEILMLISAPLIILGRPLLPLLWVLPERERRRILAWRRIRGVKSLWHMATAPITAWLLFAAALWIWHTPALYNATISNDWMHAAQHMSFLAASLLFWWSLIDRSGRKVGYGGALLYVFTTGIHATALAALLTLSPSVWYPSYLSTAPAWHLSALEDQQIGGLIMWIPASVISLFIALALLVQWLQESDRRWTYSRTAQVLRSAAEKP